MVKIRGALYSNEARGWLGKHQYARFGVVVNPYPIGLHFKNRYHSFYYSPRGWCYQVRRTWHGLQPVAERPPIPSNPQTVPQQANRAKFAQAVAAWQAKTGLEKGIWNSYNFPRHMSGYNKFIHYYLLDKPH